MLSFERLVNGAHYSRGNATLSHRDYKSSHQLQEQPEVRRPLIYVKVLSVPQASAEIKSLLVHMSCEGDSTLPGLHPGSKWMHLPCCLQHCEAGNLAGFCKLHQGGPQSNNRLYAPGSPIGHKTVKLLALPFSSQGHIHCPGHRVLRLFKKK